MFPVTIQIEGSDMVARDDKGNKRAWGEKTFARPGMCALEVAAQIFHREEIESATGSIESGIVALIKTF